MYDMERAGTALAAVIRHFVESAQSGAVAPSAEASSSVSSRPLSEAEIRSELLGIVAQAPDPDVAIERCAELFEHDSLGHSGEGTSPLQELEVTSTGFRRLLLVLGSSEELGRLMMTRPSLIKAVVDDDDFSQHRWTLSRRREAMKTVIGCDHRRAGPQCATASTPSTASTTSLPPAAATSTPSAVSVSARGSQGSGFEGAVSALRSEYYRQLSSIMAWDVTSVAEEVQPQVSDALSDLAEAALDAALSIAYTQVKDSQCCRFSIIGMGKLGAHELNYVSDVDLIYVVEPVDESVPLQRLLKIGTKLGIVLQKVCSSVLPGVVEPVLWQIDGGLRPEGKDGQLVRRLASHEEYYRTWAKNWEFQALLKARCVAGDSEIGAAYEAMASRFVWQASTRENFVFDCQQMRKRVEKLIPLPLKDREIKLGRGGLRDVEFTVQMLQLVHGRTDETLREKGTLKALDALSRGGYVSRRQADLLGADYRFERVLEHRQQMWGLRRTHLFADLGEANSGGLDSARAIREEDLELNSEARRLARVFGLRPLELVNRYDATRREVRRLHLDIYYRPMLPQIAQLSEDDIALTGSAAEERFASIGFEDPQAAMRHVRHLAVGISRSAKINRVILPAMLQWLGEGQNPDMGLLTLRKLEESFGQDSEYLGFLRDSLSAGRRLCRVVANSRYLADALTKSVESVTWLGDDEQLRSRSRQSLDIQCNLSLRRFESSIAEFATSIRALRRHEIERIGLAWMNGIVKSQEALRSMTDVYDALLQAALTWGQRHQMRERELSDSAMPARMAFIAMGRYGGREVNFSSDADVMFLYERTDVADDGALAASFARGVLDDVRAILSGPISREPTIDLDFDLRPEGKNGPLLRSYDSYREYYRKWASTWEYQALLRARFAAGDEDLGAHFLSEIANPLRYPTTDLQPKQVQEIRKLKARMEAERLPRGVRRERHLKLGKGGLSDVEWTVQFLQLCHAGADTLLQTVSTTAALHRLEESGIISASDERSLEESWKFTTDARNANFLWQGRADQADVLPDDSYSLGGISACMNRGSHRGQEFENELLAVMRHCREVMDRLFYGNGE